MTRKPKNNESSSDKGSSELVVGSVTFVIFLIFMTVWMYFGSSS